MLFPTHVGGNLPPVRHGTRNNQIRTSMWSTLDVLGSRPFTNTDWEGREVFALGGRSLYWAGCARGCIPPSWTTGRRRSGTTSSDRRATGT